MCVPVSGVSACACVCVCVSSKPFLSFDCANYTSTLGAAVAAAVAVARHTHTHIVLNFVRVPRLANEMNFHAQKLCVSMMGMKYTRVGRQRRRLFGVSTTTTTMATTRVSNDERGLDLRNCRYVCTKHTKRARKGCPGENIAFFGNFDLISCTKLNIYTHTA